MPGLYLRPDIRSSNAGHMRAGTWLSPGTGMQPPGHGGIHQLMPGRVKHDLINTMPIAIMRLEGGRIRIGIEPPLDGLLAARQPAKLLKPLLNPASPLPSYPFDQR